MNTSKDFDQGILYKIMYHVYALMMLNLYFIISNFIFILAFLFFDTTLSNLIIFFLALIPTGPSISALCYATDKLIREKEIEPAKDFFKGYRLNIGDTLKIWVPLLAVLFILIVDIQYFNLEATMFNQIAGAIFLVAIFFILCVSLYIWPINARFKFRIRDNFKLSIYYSYKKIKATTGNIGILVITFFCMYAFTDFFILFFASLICYACMLNSRVVIDEIQGSFIHD